jgi:hypothetical protein
MEYKEEDGEEKEEGSVGEGEERGKAGRNISLPLLSVLSLSFPSFSTTEEDTTNVDSHLPSHLLFSPPLSLI